MINVKFVSDFDQPTMHGQLAEVKISNAVSSCAEIHLTESQGIILHI